MVNKLLDFIGQSPDAFYATDNVRQILIKEGYQSLNNGAIPECGKKYFIIRNGSALIAFRMPEKKKHMSFVISASHTDSPCFRIRQLSALNGEYIRLNAERYGGMIAPTWMDRPLSIAGRVMVRTDNGIESRLLNYDKDTVLIPNVAPHMNRALSDGIKYDASKDYMALFCTKETGRDLLYEVAEQLHCRKEDILATELSIYNHQMGMLWGKDNEFASSPRLDDLACVYTTVMAFLESNESNHIPVLCLLDNEEIGSESKQGAGSNFLSSTLRRIHEGLGIGETEHQALVTQSFVLSCDNGHAVHPNHPELADENERVYLNRGVVIKHSNRYATDAISDAIFEEICYRTNIKTQHYSNRPDMVGGSTLGKIASTFTPAYMVDIGMAQLAMHSCFETMGSRDIEEFYRAVKACYEMIYDIKDDRIEFRRK